MAPVPLSQRTLITDAGQQVPKAGDPGACLLGVGGGEVQGLHVAAMIDGEAAAGVQGTLGLPQESLRLAALRDLVDGVDEDCGGRCG